MLRLHWFPLILQFRKAAKLLPGLVTVNLHFYLAPVSRSSIPGTINPFLTIFRGTYLQVCGIIPLKQIGTWYIDIEKNISWGTGPNPVEDFLVTAVRSTDGSMVIMFSDPWVPVHR